MRENKKFVIRSYGKSEFAWLMFPKMKDPKAAQDKLLRWIKKECKRCVRWLTICRGCSKRFIVTENQIILSVNLGTLCTSSDDS